MIKRLLLIIAVIVTILGIIFKVNPYTLLIIDSILICIVLLIAVLPWGFGCAPNPLATFFVTILLILIVLLGLQLTGFFEPLSYSNTCYVTTTDTNGTILSNITIKCP